MSRTLKLGTQLLIARREYQDEDKRGNVIIGATLKAVSKGTGIMPHNISSIEKNKGNPKLETILKLVDFYGYELRIV
jgi:transcriptional regulator with XRE-family HTH domain